MSTAPNDEPPFTVLIVCTGNICRSPIAEQLLRARLEAFGATISISSAGTTAVSGQQMTPEAAALSSSYGGIPGGHAARRLTADQVASANLVLTATREHRAEVVSLLPRSSRYSFTIRQFARLLSTARELAFEDPAPTAAGSSRASLVGLVGAVASSRGYAPPLVDPSRDDVEDPYLQSQSVYDRVGRDIDAAVTEIVDAFVSGGDHGYGESSKR
jgi:protein-tyrosine phosphatase